MRPLQMFGVLHRIVAEAVIALFFVFVKAVLFSETR